jgi:hypothetical protein
MTEEIIRKLSAELRRGITTEPQVVYLLAGIRKIIERDGLSEEFAHLKFNCDWVLHSKLEGTSAKRILHLFDRAEAAMRRDNLKFEDLPFDLTWQIDAISKMQVFETELRSFLDRYGLPPLMLGERDGWTYFLHLYTRVIQDIPLIVGTRQRPAQREPIPKPAHISHINVQCEMAKQATEFDGEKEMMFRVWWTLHIKDEEPKSFWIMNSFTMQSGCE